MTSFSKFAVAFSLKCIIFYLLLVQLNLQTLSIGGNETDYLALLQFKANMHDPQNLMSSWNDSLHFCNWEGITCGRKHRRVTVLHLPSKGLVGSLSPYVGNMSFLRKLSLPNNDLQGEIPPEFGYLFRLQILDLGNNSIEGKIPVELSNCSNLQGLALPRNKLAGSIPFQLSSLSKLTALFIHKNYLNGTIPPSLGNLTSLEILGAAGNFLIGTIPDTLGQLKRLSIFDISTNKLAGTLPMEIGNLEKLQWLTLDHNRLSGPVPTSISIRSSLIRLQLHNHNFHSAIPSGLDWQNMLFLNLAGSNLPKSNLTGEIPNELGQCKSHVNLYMEGNKFQGTLPLSFASLRGLRVLDLSRNNLSGKIPEYLEKFSLEYLNFSFNNFEGDIPIKGIFANASAIFVEGNNRICGGIPELKLPRCVNQETKRRKLDVVKLVTIAVSGVFCLIILLIFLHCKFKKNTKERPPDMLLRSFQSLSYNRILKATNGFSSENLLGVGSFGAVYKGNLEENGALIAIKVINLQQQGGLKSFMAECKVLQNIRHRNLVPIIPSCSSIDFQGNDFKALVYEFMPNGNLEKWLHPSSEMYVEANEQPSLNLVRRMDIVIDVGNALDYLHNGCRSQSFIVMNPVQCSSLGVRGTIGYTAPEGLNLHNFARMALPDNVLEIADPALLQEDEGVMEGRKVECLIGIIKVGVSCSMESPQDRMDMAKVINLQQQGAANSFVAEGKVLQNIRHRNLVRIITSCSLIDFQGNDFKELVYEYMPNGKLEKWLHPGSEMYNESKPSSKNEHCSRCTIK
ncbi:hypothetical protein JCGZ_05025 [Jatropha curcas]|uniref:Protein kinase domain-containing protein n=1 Tax=Jatropha curcas TaxID=180498 RepID=A0A067KV63_JATCU|nr:hypothetical protein JCGZ_05025 [Jatropha curcas]